VAVRGGAERGHVRLGRVQLLRFVRAHDAHLSVALMVLGREIRDSDPGFGIQNSGFGIWDSGFGIKVRLGRVQLLPLVRAHDPHLFSGLGDRD